MKKAMYSKPGKPLWVVDGLTAWTCPLCGMAAIVRLPDFLIVEQPDDTTYVCHPGIGGCNQGFAPK